MTDMISRKYGATLMIAGDAVDAVEGLGSIEQIARERLAEHARRTAEGVNGEIVGELETARLVRGEPVPTSFDWLSGYEVPASAAYVVAWQAEIQHERDACRVPIALRRFRNHPDWSSLPQEGRDALESWWSKPADACPDCAAA